MTQTAKRHRFLRLLATLGVAAGALTVVSAATPASPPTAFNPQIFVSGQGKALKIRYISSGAEDPTADVKIAVPKGYTLRAAAGRIGTAKVSFLASDLKRVVKPSAPIIASGGSSFPTEATACTGAANHTVVWLLDFTVSGTPIRVLVFGDTISTGPVASFASGSLEFCVTAPDTPRGSAGRAPLGAKLLSIELSTTGITAPSQGGIYRWRATATPYEAGTGIPKANRTVEIQSLLVTPISVTLAAKLQRVTGKVALIDFSGKLVANGNGISGIFVELLQSGKKRATLLSGKDGVFKATGKIPGAVGKTLTFVARSTQPDKDLGSGSCTTTFKPPISPTTLACSDATLPGFTVTSKPVQVAVH
jgi:hypothetical protein